MDSGGWVPSGTHGSESPRDRSAASYKGGTHVAQNVVPLCPVLTRSALPRPYVGAPCSPQYFSLRSWRGNPSRFESGRSHWPFVAIIVTSTEYPFDPPSGRTLGVPLSGGYRSRNGHRQRLRHRESVSKLTRLNCASRISASPCIRRNQQPTDFNRLTVRQDRHEQDPRATGAQSRRSLSRSNAICSLSIASVSSPQYLRSAARFCWWCSGAMAPVFIREKTAAAAVPFPISK